MSVQRKKGTSAESAVRDYVKTHGFPNAERRALAGHADKGDISGVPGVAIEVKNCAETKLAEWVDEAVVEAVNANEPVGVVWHKRRGKSSPGDWYVTMPGWAFLYLLMLGGGE